MAVVRLHCGPPNSRRSAHLSGLFRAQLPVSLLLTPTQSYADLLSERIARESPQGGLWGRRILPLAGFVSELLRSAGVKARQLAEYERQLLLEECLTAQEVQERMPAEVRGQIPGFARHLLRIITGLKQAAIEPEDFARKTAKTGDAMDEVVALAYAAYQTRLRELGLYDVPGLYWEAELQCRAGRPRMLEGVTQIIFDGFDDFTPSEFRLMLALEPMLEELHVGINYDDRTNRQDLFQLPARAARDLSRHFGVTPIAHQAPTPTSYSEFAAEHLFWRDKPRWQPGMQPNLAVDAYSDALHEVEGIGRQVKALLLSGEARAEEVAIVFRDLSEAGPLLHQTLREFGVPHRLRLREALAGTGAGGALLHFLETTGPWHREQILEFLLSPLVMLPEGRHRAAFPALARRALIISGCESWEEGLRGLAHRLTAGESRDARELIAWMPQAAEALEDFRGAVRWLRGLAGMLPAEAPAAVFARAVEALLRELGMAEAVMQLPEALRAREADALAALRGLLEAFAASALGEAPLARAEFVERLRLALDEVEISPRGDRAGVLCTDAAGLRNQAFKHVFFGGLNEGVLPAPPSGNAVYSELDRTRLREAGVSLEGRWEHAARERLLFHHVLLAARGQLRLSWRTTQKGREALASHYLIELRALFSPYDPLPEAAPGTDSFLPGAGAIASARDLRNAVFFERNGLKAHRGRFPDGVAAARIEEVRHDESEWSTHDGVLHDPEILEQLADQFGEKHVFSTGQLEKYLACPFRFFVERVLRVSEVETPEVVLDALARGTILHDALRRLHQQHADIPMREIPAETLHAWAVEGLAEAFEAHAWLCAAASPALIRLEQLRLRRMLELYVEIALREDESWAPVRFEVAFGQAPRNGGEPSSGSDPFKLKAAGDVAFSGRVDRIDRQGDLVRIVDYKSGGLPSVGAINEGRDLQLVLYAMAVEQLMAGEVTCSEAVYLAVGKNKRCTAFNTGRRNVRAEVQRRVLENIQRATAGIRAGQFPPAPEGLVSCPGCGGTHPCRFERARAERKMQQD